MEETRVQLGLEPGSFLFVRQQWCTLSHCASGEILSKYYNFKESHILLPTANIVPSVVSFCSNHVSSFSQVPVLRPIDLMVEATPRRIFSNAHTYHINSISVNSDYETYMSTDDLRINLWNLEITNQSFSIPLQSDGWWQSEIVACLKNIGSLFFC